MSIVLALFIDVIILVLLGAAIFYMIRLTKGLESFKEHRHEFDSVIANLLTSIDQAENSVRTLKEVSATEAGELERMIGQAQSLSEELKIINAAGESMAKRLEKLAETNRQIVQPSSPLARSRRKPSPRPSKPPPRYEEPKEERISSPVTERNVNPEPPIEENDQSYGSTLKRVRKDEPPQEQDLPSFMIQDRDQTSANNDEDLSDNLQSDAEKELYEALRSSKKNITKGR